MASTRLVHFLIVAGVMVLLMAPLSLAHAESIGQWTTTTKYPLALGGESCVAVSTRIYCVGGFGGGGNSHNQVYSATLGASGIGNWSAEPTYPINIDSASCVNATGGIYCVGGENYPNNVSNVYFASFSSSGLYSINSWSGVGSYPNALAGVSCVAYSGYIYCIGGFTNNGDEVGSAYYASTSSGLGVWSSTTQYPLAVDRESCTVIASYIYCVGGETVNGSNQNSPIDSVYYAPLSSSGIGQWAAGLAYPTALAALSCTPDSGYVYCIGGFDSQLLGSTNAYFGQASASGVVSWTDLAQYPIPVDTSSCVTTAGYIYCVAGNSVTQSSQSALNPTSSAYYAAISSPVTTTTTPEFPVAVAIPITFAAALVIGALATRVARKKNA